MECDSDYRTRQAVAGLALVELLSRHVARFGIINPAEREQRALHAPQLVQGCGDTALSRG